MSSEGVRSTDLPDAPPARVRGVQAAMHPWPTTVRVQGSLLSDEEAIISAKVAGRVQVAAVDRGVAVEDGEVLIKLETREYALQVRQAEGQVAQIRAKLGLTGEETAQVIDRHKAPQVMQLQALLEEARFKAERARVLYGRNAIPLEELQRNEIALRVIQAQYAAALNEVEEQLALLALRKTDLALAQQRLADATIRASFAGTIQERHVAPGVFVNPGDPVVTLVRTDPLRFRASVPEREANRIHVDEDVYIYLENQSAPLCAKITRVSPALDLESRSLVIEATVPNPGGRLRAGLFAEAEIVVAPDAQTLAVPESAVTEFAGVEKVMIYDGQQAREQRIVSKRRDKGLVEISDGLTVGQWVILEADQCRPGPVVCEMNVKNTPRHAEADQDDPDKDRALTGG
ncbi:MAG: efflux RND transporter periplasmic adaptor subunit [Gemmataceae bacterium]